MSWTKSDFAYKALEEIGYAAYIYDVMPEQLQSVLISLDNMMATWSSNGIRLGYYFESTPANITASQVVNVPQGARQAIITNLACVIAPRFGKQASPELSKAAKTGYTNLLTNFAEVYPMHLPTSLPLGQGNKPWRRIQSPQVQPAQDTTTDADTTVF